MKQNMIVAVGKNGEMGKDNDLPWGRKQKGDLAYFKRETLGDATVMGWNTWDSIPPDFKPFTGRTTIVLSSTRESGKFDIDGREYYVVPNFERAIELAEELGHDTLWYCGGVSVYEKAKEIVDEMYVTVIDGEHEADTFLEWAVEPAGFTKAKWPAKHNADNKNANDYTFYVWKRITKARS